MDSCDWWSFGWRQLTAYNHVADKRNGAPDKPSRQRYTDMRGVREQRSSINPRRARENVRRTPAGKARMILPRGDTTESPWQTDGWVAARPLASFAVAAQSVTRSGTATQQTRGALGPVPHCRQGEAALRIQGAMLGICRSRRARRAVPLLVLLGIGGFFVAQQARKGSTGSPLVNAGGAVSQGGVRRDVPAVAVKPYVAPAPPPPPTTTTTRRRAPPTTPFVPARPLTTELHPAYKSLLRSYPYQPVRDNHGNFVNIILVRAAPGARDIALYEKYKNELLFIGISSFEDFPLPSVNPFSAKYPADKYVGMFPGFLHMMREPEKHFPPHVKLLLMSQSDFSLPSAPKHDYSVPRKWDFTYSGSDQDVRNDCVGWSSFAKNWSFAKEAMEVMCGEFGMTGVLVATKSKDGSKACTIPASCRGKVR